MSEVMLRPEAKSIGLSGRNGRKKQSLLVATRHNLRDIQQELGADSHIDATRICLNEILAGPATPAGVVELAEARRAEIGFASKRKDYTQAHEMVFSLPANTAIDTSIFFKFCTNFVAGEFGRQYILSAVIHRDEGAPHLHVLILPVADGKYVGSRLITKPSLADLIDKFAMNVMKAFGVKVMKKLAGEARAKVVEEVQEKLKAALARPIDGPLLDVILTAARRNPAQFMTALGITPSSVDTPLNDGGAEFRRIALSAGKGRKTERVQKPYGFGRDEIDDEVKSHGFESWIASDHKNIDTIPCVVSPDQLPLFPPTEASKAEDPACSGNEAADGQAGAAPPTPAKVEPDHIENLAPGLVGAGVDHLDATTTVCQRPPVPSGPRGGRPREADCKGGASSQDSTTSAIVHDQGAEAVSELIRVKDCELDPSHWDEQRGEFFPSSPVNEMPPSLPAKASSEAWVNSELSKRARALKQENSVR